MIDSISKAGYSEWTDYRYEIGGMKRLRFIIGEIFENFGSTKNNIEILDFGCGKGNIALPLACIGYNMIGVDIDKKSIDIASERNVFPKAIFLHCDIKDLQQNKLFDVIICSEVIEHIVNPAFVLKSLKELLKPNGVFIISIPNGYSMLESYWRILSWIKTKKMGRILKRIKNKTICHDCELESIETANISDYHIQHYSMTKFKELIKNQHMQILKAENSSSILMDMYYLFLKLFIKEGSVIFRILDRMDNLLAISSPSRLATGWMFTVKYK